MKEYGDGHIIVAASSVDEARQFATEDFEKWLLKNHAYVVEAAKREGTDDEDDWFSKDCKAELDDYRAKFERDIKKEPEVIRTAFIRGSE